MDQLINMINEHCDGESLTQTENVKEISLNWKCHIITLI